MTISVITPTYNRAEVLPTAIDSVLEQTIDDWEMLIIDDGSTDNTQRVVESYDDERINYIYQSNKGANSARNNGVRNASGDIISFLDSDDELAPCHLERIRDELISADDSCVGAHTAMKIQKDSHKMYKSVPEGRISFDDLMSSRVACGFSATSFEQRVFDEVGYLDEELPAAQDFDFFVRVLTEFDIIGIPHPLVTINATRSDQISSDIERKTKGFERIREKHGGQLTSERIANQHYMLAFQYAESGDLSQARQEFRNAIVTYPRNPLYYYHYITTFGGESIFNTALSIKHTANRLNNTYL
jgi:glycosyltransferase involved in cell wall biosynthesis